MPNLLIPIFVILAGLVFTLTYRGARLDLEQKKIKQYVGLFGIKIGPWKPLPELSEIVFTSGKYSQQIHSIVSRRQLDTKLFRAFLKGPDDYKQLFSASGNPDKVLAQVMEAASKLNLPATNYTTRPPRKII